MLAILFAASLCLVSFLKKPTGIIKIEGAH